MTNIKLCLLWIHTRVIQKELATLQCCVTT